MKTFLNILVILVIFYSGTLYCQNIDIGASSYVYLQDKTFLTVYGNIIKSGTLYANSSTVSLQGSSTQTLKGDIVFGTLKLNNANGITLSSSVSSSVTVSNALTMSGGNIVTNDNTITLGSSGSNPGTLSRTAGTIIGNFRRWIPASTVSDVLFPVGSAVYYRPATVSITAAPVSDGIITAKYVQNDPGNNGTVMIDDNGYNLDAYSKSGYWQINSNLSGMTYSLSLNADQIPGVNNYDKLRIIKRPNSSASWYIEGVHSPGTGSNSSPIVNRTALTAFSEFAIGGKFSDNPLEGILPVKLLSFNYNMNGRDVNLFWKTAIEINNYGFDIERSSGDGWKKIGFIKGNGNSGNTKEYSFNDRKLSAGKYLYRIKQTDYNGNFEYFNLNSEIEILTPKKFSLSQNYPNPFNPETKIDFSVPSSSNVRILVFDAAGRQLASLLNEDLKAGYYTVAFNSSGLSSGTYFYKLISGKNSLTGKMVLIK